MKCIIIRNSSENRFIVGISKMFASDTKSKT
jgi:hypothetical protein